MKKVICTLPNASELINGVKFVSHKDGMISEDVSEEQAAAFTAIPGFRLAVAEKAPEDDGAMEALKARAAAVGLSVDARWKVDRLTAEVEKAEKAKAA